MDGSEMTGTHVGAPRVRAKTSTRKTKSPPEERATKRPRTEQVELLFGQKPLQRAVPNGGGEGGSRTRGPPRAACAGPNDGR